MILVDSSVWIDYFRGTPTPQAQRLDELLEREPLLIGDLILAEVLQGFTRDREFNRAKELLTALTVVDLGGKEIAIQAAKNYGSPKSPVGPRRAAVVGGSMLVG